MESELPDTSKHWVFICLQSFTEFHSAIEEELRLQSIIIIFKTGPKFKFKFQEKLGTRNFLAPGS